MREKVMETKTLMKRSRTNPDADAREGLAETLTMIDDMMMKLDGRWPRTQPKCVKSTGEKVWLSMPKRARRYDSDDRWSIAEGAAELREEEQHRQ